VSVRDEGTKSVLTMACSLPLLGGCGAL
jgi:hypothetical protein